MRHSTVVTYKPTFIVIGAMKCGTTSICDLLGSHPEVFICNPKEPNFFSKDEIFLKGFGWYESLFSHAKNKNARGEGSPSYSIAAQYPKASERIAEYNPNCRIIYIVRHPLRRIESDWRQRKRYGVHVSATFTKTIRDYPLLETSLYWEQLSHYRNFFPDDQILIVFFEEFVADPYVWLQECFKHIGVDPTVYVPGASQASNAASDWKTDSPLGSFLRRFPVSQQLWDLTPDWLHNVARPLLTKKLLSRRDRNPSWDEPTKRLVIDALVEDTRSLLSHCGRPTNFWSLE